MSANILYCTIVFILFYETVVDITLLWCEFTFSSLAIANDNTLDESMINVDDIHLRSYFPQSWMWTIVDSDNSGTVR